MPASTFARFGDVLRRAASYVLSGTWWGGRVAGIFGGSSRAGEYVDEDSAMAFSAVYRAVTLIAGTEACLPLHVYRSVGGDHRRQDGHPLELLLNRSPNDEQDAVILRETWVSQCLRYGRSFLEVERNGYGEPVALWQTIPPDVVPMRAHDARRTLYYRLGSAEVPASKLVHLNAIGPDGICGWSPIRQARETIGLGLAAERYGATFFGNGGRPSGMYEVPHRLNDLDRKAMREQLGREHGTADAAGRIMILEGGAKYTPTSVPPEDAQFLLTRKFQISEIARWYGVAPHLLGDLDRATFSNIEQQGAEFLIYSLTYWLTRIRQCLDRRLLTPEERAAGFYLQHRTEALFRSDLSTRYAAYQVGRNGGWMSVNEIRSREDLPRIDGGDAYLEPLNMRPVGGTLPANPELGPAPPAPDPATKEPSA